MSIPRTQRWAHCEFCALEGRRSPHVVGDGTDTHMQAYIGVLIISRRCNQVVAENVLVGKAARSNTVATSPARYPCCGNEAWRCLPCAPLACQQGRENKRYCYSRFFPVDHERYRFNRLHRAQCLPIMTSSREKTALSSWGHMARRHKQSRSKGRNGGSGSTNKHRESPGSPTTRRMCMFHHTHSLGRYR